MLHPSTKRLIDKLEEMTAQRRIEWTAGDDGSVIYDAEGYRVALTAEPSELVLLDPLGNELERSTSDDLASDLTADGRSYAGLVTDMRREATRIARGTEHAISRVLEGLEKIGAEPETPEEPEEDVGAEAQTDETEIAAGALDAPAVSAAVEQLAAQVNTAPAEPEPAAEPAPVVEAAPEPAPEPQPAPTAQADLGSAIAGAAASVYGASAITQPEPTPVEPVIAAEPAPVPEPEPAPEPVETVADAVMPVIEDVAPAEPEAGGQALSAAEAELAMSNAMDVAEAEDVVNAPAEPEPVPAPSPARNFSTFSAFSSPAVGTGAAASVAATASTAADTAQETADTVAETVDTAVQEANDSIQNAFGGATDGADAMAEAVTPAGEALDGLPDALDTAAETLGAAPQAAMDTAKDAAAGLVETATEATAAGVPEPAPAPADPEATPEGEVKPVRRFNPWN